MIEEQITKKPIRAKRLSKGLIATAKYLFIAVLVFSLIAGLLLQAPWKVLTLIAIILATLTVIPKPARKWIWMTFGLIIITLIIWVFLPDDDSNNWKPFTFKDEIAAFEAARAIPDEDNAATIYNQLLANYDEQAFDPDFHDEDPDDLTMDEPWLSRDHPKIAQWLQKHQNTIATLIQASRKDKCNLPTYFDHVGLDKHLDISSPFIHWAYLLIRGANNDLGHGRIDQAITKYTAALKLGDHLKQQPEIIDVLVGYAIESMAFDMFKTFTVAPYATEQHLDALEKSIEDLEYNWQSYWSATIDHEKLFLKNGMLALFYEINSKYKTRFARDPTAAIRKQLMDMGPAYPNEDFDLVPTYCQKKLIKACTIVAWFVIPTPQEAGKIVDVVYQRYYAMAKPDFDWEKGPEELSFTSIRLNFRILVEMLAFLSESGWHKIHDIYPRTIAMKRATRVMIALRCYKNEHGNWPENLNKVKSFVAEEIFIDPVNAGQFVYKLTDDGFTLYSKGKNNIDENGEKNVSFGKPGEWPKPQEDDILIWPRKTQKPNEVTI